MNEPLPSSICNLNTPGHSHVKSRRVSLLMLLSSVVIITLAATVASSSVTARDVNAKAFYHNLQEDFYLREARNSENSAASRLSFYDSITNKGNPDISICFEQGDLLENMGQFERARKLYEQLGMKISPDSIRMYADYLLRLASAQYYSNRIADAVKNAYIIIDLEKPDSLMYVSVEALRLLAHIFSYGKTHTLANSYIDRALEAYGIFAKSSAPKFLKDYTLGNIHYTLSSFALSEANFPKAFDEIKLARQLQSSSRPQSFFAMNLALIYHQQGELDIAEKYYKDIIATPDYHPDYMNAVLNYVQLKLEKHDFEGAAQLLKNYESRLNYLVGTPWEGNMYYVQHQVADSLRLYQESNYYLNRAYSRLDSLGMEQNQLYLENLADIYEGRDRDAQNRHLKGYVSLWKWLFYGICIILTVCILAALIFRNRAKRNGKETNKLNERVSILEKTLRHNEERAQETIGERSRQLSAMTMRMKSLNIELADIEKVVNNQSLSREEISAKVKASLKKLSAQDNVWEMFRVYFEEVNQRFFDKLYNAAPNLTKSEVRMCAYILTGMTTKEIASLTNRSVRTVDCIKYNIRRKLNITDSTEAFVRKLSAENIQIDS